MAEMAVQDTEQLELERVAEIETALAKNDARKLSSLIASITDADARHLLFRVDADVRTGILSLADADLLSGILEPLPNIEIALLIEALEPARAAELLSRYSAADQAHILEELDADDAAAITAEINLETAVDIGKLRSYPEGSAGWLMNPTPLKFKSNSTIGDVLKQIIDEENALDSADGQHPYVIDGQGRLVGFISLHSLLTEKRSTPLDEVAQTALALSDHASLDDLRDFFDEHDFLGAPILDENGKLIGAISKDTAMDAIRARLHANAQKARGVVGDELRTMHLLFRSRRRLSWLSANIFLNVIAASVISAFEPTLSAVIALAVFLPMVSDMSGCSGNQAVAVSMREISLGLARPSDLFRVWLKEVSVGLINGLVLGLIIGLVVFAWKGNAVLGGVIGLALAVNTVIAVSIGGCVPLILKRFKVDPAVASGPLLTTITDMAGFFLVLGLATLTLPWLV